MTNISPYLFREAKRLSMIDAIAPAREHFSKEQGEILMNDYDVKLERTGPAIEPAWHGWIAGALVVFAIAVYFVVF